MKAKTDKPTGTTLRGQAEGNAEIYGLEEAKKLVRSGRFISAIKYLEAANRDITLEQAKAIVQAFGYSQDFRGLEMNNQTIRCP